MNSIELGILIILVYLCVYALINRICKCVEYCAMARSYDNKVNAENTRPEIKNPLETNKE